MRILFLILSSLFIVGCPFKGHQDDNQNNGNPFGGDNSQYNISNAEISIDAKDIEGLVTTDEALPSAIPSMTEAIPGAIPSANAIHGMAKGKAKLAVSDFSSSGGGLFGIRETGFEPIIKLLGVGAEEECPEDNPDCNNGKPREEFPTITDVAVFPFTNESGQTECMMAFATAQPVVWFDKDKDPEKFALYCSGEDAEEFINDEWRAANCTNSMLFGVVDKKDGLGGYELFSIEPMLRVTKDGGDQLFQYQGGKLYYKATSDAIDGAWAPPSIMTFNANRNENTVSFSDPSRRKVAFDGSYFWIRYFYTNPEAPPNLFGLYVLAESKEDGGSHESFFRFLSTKDELVTITSKEWDIPVAFNTTKTIAGEKTGGEIIFMSRDPIGNSKDNNDWQRNLYRFNAKEHFDLRTIKGQEYCASDSAGTSWVPVLYDYKKDANGEPILDENDKIEYLETTLSYTAEECLHGWETNYQGDERYYIGSHCRIKDTYRHVTAANESACVDITTKKSVTNAQGALVCAQIDSNGSLVAVSPEISFGDKGASCPDVIVEDREWVAKSHNAITDPRNAYKIVVKADDNNREDQNSCTSGGIVLTGDSTEADLAIDAEDRTFISGSFRKKDPGTYIVEIRHEGPYCETDNFWGLLQRVEKSEAGALDELKKLQALDTIDLCMPKGENVGGGGSSTRKRWNGPAPSASDGYCMVSVHDDKKGINFEYYVRDITKKEDCTKEKVQALYGKTTFPYGACRTCDNGCSIDVTKNQTDCTNEWNSDHPWYWWEYRNYGNYNYRIKVSKSTDTVNFTPVHTDSYDRRIERSWCEHSGDYWNSENKVSGVVSVGKDTGRLTLAANQEGVEGVGEVKKMLEAGRQVFLQTGYGGDSFIFALDFQKIDATSKQPKFTNSVIKLYAEIKDVSEIPGSYSQELDSSGNLVKTVENFTLYFLDLTNNKHMKNILTRTYVKGSDGAWTASYSQTEPEVIELKINQVSVFNTGKVSCKSIGVQE